MSLCSTPQTASRPAAAHDSRHCTVHGVGVGRTTKRGRRRRGHLAARAAHIARAERETESAPAPRATKAPRTQSHITAKRSQIYRTTTHDHERSRTIYILYARLELSRHSHTRCASHQRGVVCRPRSRPRSRCHSSRQSPRCRFRRALVAPTRQRLRLEVDADLEPAEPSVLHAVEVPCLLAAHLPAAEVEGPNAFLVGEKVHERVGPLLRRYVQRHAHRVGGHGRLGHGLGAATSSHVDDSLRARARRKVSRLGVLWATCEERGGWGGRASSPCTVSPDQSLVGAAGVASGGGGDCACLCCRASRWCNCRPRATRSESTVAHVDESVRPLPLGSRYSTGPFGSASERRFSTMTGSPSTRLRRSTESSVVGASGVVGVPAGDGRATRTV
jgi:hypothetical protein